MEAIKNRGFTLVEILFACSIAVILVLIVYASFNDLKHSKLLDQETNKVLSVFHRAYTDTLSGLGGTNYGVHLDSDKIVLFTGNTYDQNEATNKTTLLDPQINIQNINLGAGVSDVIFSKLTGEASVEGTIDIVDIVKPDFNKRITVKILGVVVRD